MDPNIFITYGYDTSTWMTSYHGVVLKSTIGPECEIVPVGEPAEEYLDPWGDWRDIKIAMPGSMPWSPNPKSCIGRRKRVCGCEDPLTCVRCQKVY